MNLVVLPGLYMESSKLKTKFRSLSKMADVGFWLDYPKSAYTCSNELPFPLLELLMSVNNLEKWVPLKPCVMVCLRSQTFLIYVSQVFQTVSSKSLSSQTNQDTSVQWSPFF